LESLESKRRLPDQDLEDKQIDDLVIDACTEMPFVYLFEFLLRHYDQLSYEEISETCRVPLGTVRSRIHRGRDFVAAYVRERLTV
jgi:RNA polymerase sigma-70 factor (ECF subfamily)